MQKNRRGPHKGTKYTGSHRFAFGRALATERRRKGYTQAELAQLIGKSKRVISNFERAVQNPSAESLKKLATALKIPVERLVFPGEEPATKAVHIDRGLSKRFEVAQKLPAPARNELKRIIDMMARAHGITDQD
jgi:transcriptional regulator with XRE-family HTH domain